MSKQTFQIEKMPFFERFEGTGKAVIYTVTFEKWLQEVFGNESKDQYDKNIALDSEKNDITASLNSVYKTESSSIDPILMKMQADSIENESW